MPKFAANLTMMFNEAPFPDRFAAAADAGFEAVEYLFPYDHEPEEIAARLRRYSLTNVMFNMPAGDWGRGDRGMACIPGREEEFRAGVEKALTYARTLGVTRIHAMAGIAPADGNPDAIHATYIGNLRYAAEKLASDGITLLIEAINLRDIPGFYVNTQAQSHAAMQAVGLSNVKMQLDLYHAQIVEGDLETRLRKYISHVGHIQIASVPKRNEPGSGEVNYPYLFGVIDEIGYDGWIGCEYRPAGNTVEGLGWFRVAAGGAGV